MPWEIRRNGEEYCVYPVDGGKVEGCHPTEEEAKSQMRALYANEEKETLLERFISYATYLKENLLTTRGRPIAPLHGEEVVVGAASDGVEAAPGFVVFKENDDGRRPWLGVVSNNRLDRDKEIIKAEAHEYFIKALDTGVYKQLMGQDYPELWLWHTPFGIGESHNSAFDQRGFVITGGYSYRGDLYGKIFDRLDAYGKEHPGELMMSHGMPQPFVVYADDDPRDIVRYLDKEYTVLPNTNAANELTTFLVLEKDNMPLQIDERKRQWFKDLLGDELLGELDDALQTVSQAADAARIPKKEINMSDVEKTSGTDAAAGNVQETTQTAAAVAEQKASDMPADDEEEEDDEKEQAPAYVTEQALAEAIKEVVSGVSQAVGEIKVMVKEAQDAAQAAQAAAEEFNKKDAQRVGEVAQQTPQASLSAIIAKSILASTEAEIKSDDPLSEQTQYQEYTKEADAAPTIVPSINKAMSRQRGMRVVQDPRLGGN